MNKLGAVVIRARRAKGLSQKDLASAIIMPDGKRGMSAAYLNDIEHDRRRPSSPHVIRALGELLEIDVSYLQMLASNKLPDDVAVQAANVDEDSYRDALQVFRRALEERGKKP